VRNIFNQYDQTENRVTHALLTALHEDRVLLGLFVRELVGVKAPVPPSKLTLLSQRYPGEVASPESEDEENERRGIPDGWIFSIDAEWCAFIESKVQAALSLEQIGRHKRAAIRLGFRTVIAIAITSGRDLPKRAPRGTILLRWSDVYEWLIRHRDHWWATKAAEFLEITEAKLISTEKFSEGTLTMFAGFPFGRDRHYTYLEGKRTLLLAWEALRASKALQKQLGVNPRIAGRSAITGSQSDIVWNFLAISGGKDAVNFTRYPHLSLGVRLRDVDAMVTIPNAVNSKARRALVGLGEDGFRTIIEQIVRNMKPLMHSNPGMVPLLNAQQRRWRSMRSQPSMDARIDFDLRTAVPGVGPVVVQPLWLSAAYGALARKRGANYELQVGAVFPYDKCPSLQKASAIRMIEQAWLACKPLVDVVR
jgi:hypothetical protein